MPSGLPPYIEECSDRAAPGEHGIWVIIFGDLAIFALFFVYYASCYRDNSSVFAQQQLTLNRSVGLANTILLITSSYWVAKGVRIARKDHDAYRRYLGGAIGCGIGFILLKANEWAEKLASGISPNSGSFFMFYFTLSGIHLVHLVVGLVLLALLRSRASNGGLRSAGLIEGGALFWHLVDVLWVFLFPLLYLVRA